MLDDVAITAVVDVAKYDGEALLVEHGTSFFSPVSEHGWAGLRRVDINAVNVDGADLRNSN